MGSFDRLFPAANKIIDALCCSRLFHAGGLKYVPMHTVCSCAHNDTERDELNAQWVNQARRPRGLQPSSVHHS